MLWLGWIDADTTWSAASRRLMHEVEARLISAAFSPTWDCASLLVRMPQAEPVRTDGKWSSLTVEASPRQHQRVPVRWAGVVPPRDALVVGDPSRPLPAVQVTIRDHNGRPLAGVHVIPDGIVTIEEIRQAVQASFESGVTRPGRYAVLASARRPLPSLRQRQGGESSWNLSVFRCDNPTCPSRKQEVLVPAGPIVAVGAGAGAVAYPCPTCYGAWQERWALTWIRALSPSDSTPYKVVEYQVPPTQRRHSALPGRMASVVTFPQPTTLCGWTGPVVRRLPTKMSRFLRSGTPSALCAALRHNPELCGALLPGVLTADNFRALIDYTRRLPLRHRLGGLATALAFGFSPRRTAFYTLDQDAAQHAHYHYIAYNPEQFLRKLQFYGVLHNAGRFLDVGCGVGEKVFLAYALGAFGQCDGLEYDARTAAIAAFLLQRMETQPPYPIAFFQGDALTFPHYGRYDVIYMYRPMRDAQLMNRLFRHIAASMRPGALVFDVFQDNCGLRKKSATQFVTIRPLPARPTGIWDIPISLDDFLNNMGLDNEAVQV